MYKLDHIRILKVLATALPKRPTFVTKDIVGMGFKRQENADRRVRNAFRKLRSDNHIEKVRRGEYRLTATGAALCKRLVNSNWDVASEAERAMKRHKMKIRRKKVKKAVKVRKTNMAASTVSLF